MPSTLYSITHDQEASPLLSSGGFQAYESSIAAADDKPRDLERTNPTQAISLTVNEPKSQKEKIQHLGNSRQYWRDMILGINDGLVSTFLLVAGVAGGGLSSTDILLTGLAGAIAGAISMAAGEYVATKSQNEVLEGEIQLEKQHIEYFRESELKEVKDRLLTIIGINAFEQRDLTYRLIHHYKNNTDALLKIMTALEFGVLDDEVRSPVKAGLFSCLLFTAGALPSVIPFIIFEPFTGLIVAAIMTTMALLAVGGVKTWATRGNWITSAMENMCIAGVGGVFAYGIGSLFDALLHKEELNIAS